MSIGMDFTLGETEQAVASAAAEVLDHAQPPAEPEADDTALWKELSRAGLLSLALPAFLGGDELGVMAVATALTEIGRRAAPVPALATLALGVLPVVRWGDRDLQEAVLDGVASGDTLLTAAVREPSQVMPAVPATMARLADGSGTVSGVKIGVPCAAAADWILVPARITAGGTGTAVMVVARSASGLSWQRTPSSTGQPEYVLRLDAAPVSYVLGAGTADRAVTDLYQLASAGACCLADGAVAGALSLTTKHVAAREQFGRPLATFQAAAEKIADVYITSRTLHLATLSACWRLDTDRGAAADLDVAAYWLADRAPSALQTCHHLHGGIGMDISYPLHRYSSLVKDLVRFVGGADHRLDRLAARVCDQADGDGTGRGGLGGSSPRDGTGVGMFLDVSPDQLALRDELRAYFATLISPDEREAMLTERHGPVYREIVRRMGRDGWLGVGWPTEFGGRGLGQVENQIFVGEAARADVPLPLVTLQTVGPTLQAHGTAQQKDFFLPKILAGEVHFAIGYTEPEAGTDLAALRTKAVRDGDTYVVNGQKIFTTGAHDADYIWLACRTDPDAPRHKGISILIVDTTDPGFSWTPIITHDGAHHVNATYYSDVRVPVTMRVAEENAGWRLVTTQLNHERVALGPAGRIAALYDRVRDWAEERSGPDGRPLLGMPDVRRALAETYACMRINELLNWQVAVAPTMDVADASATKVFASERLQRIGQLLEDVVGRHGDPADSGTAELLRWLDIQAKRNTVLTFGGGVNEIQRELIATAGLGLPRVPR